MRYFSRLESNALGFIFGFGSVNELETVVTFKPNALDSSLEK